MAEAGVDRALCICTTMEEFAQVHGLALAHDNFWSTVGVHPDNEGVREPEVPELVAAAKQPRVVAIGETGLDYYRLEGRSLEAMEWQRQRFRVHIRAAVQAGVPLVIHTRSAAEDTLRLLKEEAAERAGGVFHCFTESQAVADAALEMGFFISFSGILTFRNAQALREVARRVPLDRCLIETDSPYLAPAPFRGKTNSPALVPWVARTLAEVKELPLEAVAEATSHNFERLFLVGPGN
jgi:TatD DNase family protein